MPRALAIACLAALLGCAPAGPRFPSEVAAAFRRDHMRHLKTDHVELYYPEEHQAQAMRLARHLDGCVSRLRGLPLTQHRRDPVLVFLTSANINNAYAYPSIIGSPRQIVVPTQMSLDLFAWFDFASARIEDEACHEATHYVHAEQTENPWAAVNWLLGDVFSPNFVLEPWFEEGLATFYEAHTGREVGRPYSPIWRAAFESGVAAHGFSPGDLNEGNRAEYPWGAAYLSGGYFINWLVEKYGEEKLWALIDDQARSIVSPFLVSLRFKAIYGLTLDALVTEFSKELEAQVRDRKRPAAQRVLDGDLGYVARLAPMPGGGLVTLSAHLDDVDRLTVREADGRVRFSRNVTPILPFRPYQSSNPQLVSGLSAVGGRRGPGSESIFFVADEIGIEGAETSRLVELDGRTGDFVRAWGEFLGLGGEVSPDGKQYALVQISGDAANLAVMELATGRIQPLTHLPAAGTVATPAWSPDGARIAFTQWGESSFDLMVREPDGTVRALTHDAVLDFSPRWLDAERIAFIRGEGGSAQVYVADVRTGALERQSAAPFLAFDPAPMAGGRIAFLNREGWHWTLDEIPAAASQEAPPPVPRVLSPAPSAAALAQGPTEVRILSDEPYQPGDHLLYPELRGVIALPFIHYAVGPLRLGYYAGFMVKGADRLGFHNYTVNFEYTSGLSSPSAVVTYGTHLAAPWYIQLNAYRAVTGLASFSSTSLAIDELGESVETGASLDLGRTFWTTPVSLSLHGFSRDDAAFGSPPSVHMQFVGAEAAFSYAAGIGSPYGGQRLGIALSGDVSGYSRALGSTFDMADLGVAISGSVPLPGLKLQTLRLGARGRWLPGAPPDLLQVGGFVSGVPLWDRGSAEGGQGAPYPLPSTISFGEYLRGYEDYGILANGAAIFDARYRYPFIIDRGTTSTFYLLPSFFLRQVDLELWADAAFVGFRRTFRAAGAAISLRTAFGSVLPVSLGYEFAYRFDGGLAAHHQVFIAFQ